MTTQRDRSDTNRDHLKNTSRTFSRSVLVFIIDCDIKILFIYFALDSNQFAVLFQFKRYSYLYIQIYNGTNGFTECPFDFAN